MSLTLSEVSILMRREISVPDAICFDYDDDDDYDYDYDYGFKTVSGRILTGERFYQEAVAPLTRSVLTTVTVTTRFQV